MAGSHYTMNRSTYCKVCHRPNRPLQKVKTDSGTKYMCSDCTSDRVKEANKNGHLGRGTGIDYIDTGHLRGGADKTNS